MPVTLTNNSKGQTGQGSILSIGSITGTGSGSETFAALGELVSLDFDGGSRTINDATHMLSNGKVKLGGLLDEGKVTMTCNRLPVGADPGIAALKAALYTGGAYDFKFVLGPDAAAGQVVSGDTRAFSAIVATGPKLSFTVDKIAQISFTLEIAGVITETAGS